MSCQIKGIANLVNPRDIRQCLLGDADKKFDNVREGELPLQHCLVSLSPVGDILAIACNRRLIILASKWDSQESSQVKNKFHIVWDGEIAPKNEWITSVICLPLISHGKSSAGPDWTCIGVGLNNGSVKFYTETGGFLIQEQFHNESIINIKCQSHTSARHSGDAGTSEEIHVLYNTVVCILQGFPLFSTLRAHRNHLARVKANCDDTPPPASSLVCKKWGFKSQDFVNDAEVIGSTCVNTFDHLMTASISGGYNASYRSSAPQHSLVLATGKRPFMGFHFALEGGAAPVLSDVAIAMASKVASAIGSAVPWFRGGAASKSTAAEKAKSLTAEEPTEPMACRFGLSDILREGDCLTTSPNKLLSVVCDALGRVILVDNKQGIAVKMWKGYRDAQCGWIEAVEERGARAKAQLGKVGAKPQAAPKRTALFLVIYAPKMGIIDIWSVQFGIKITTFSASKNGRLLYTNYGLCGLNDVAASAAAAANRAQHPCVFMDPLGGMREIVVPFHFALSSRNRNRATDMHLFKKLKSFLREEEFDEPRLTNEITNTCAALRTNDVRLQTIEMLMTSKHVTPDSLLAATNCLLAKQSSDVQGSDDDAAESAVKALARTTSQLRRAIKFYKYIRAQFDRPPEYCTVASADIGVPDRKQLSAILFTSEREVQRVLKLAKSLADLSGESEAATRAQGARVSFKDDGRSFLDFLGCFEFGSAAGLLGLRRDMSHDKKCQIANLMYQGWMYSSDPISKWQEYALNSDIQPAVLMEFALLYWLAKRSGGGGGGGGGARLEVELVNFTKLLNAICSLSCDSEEVYAGYNQVSHWWREVRKILSDSDNPFGALTAAMACRAVSVSIQRNRDRSSGADDDGNAATAATNEPKTDEREDSSSPEEESVSYISDWENVSRDTCQFSLLIGNLEDITMLSAIVSVPPTRDESTQFHALPYESTGISLSLVLCKGRGSVSEIVAKWLSSAGVDPRRLVDTSDVEFSDRPACPDEAAAAAAAAIEVGSEPAAKGEPRALANLLDKVALLKRHFPYSLSSSVLLANLAWEYAMSWNKDVGQLSALEAALGALRAIPSRRARHGLCCLLWAVHLRKRLESVGKLVNKLGKLPRERLCMQDVGLSDVQAVAFLRHCAAFLDTFLDVEVTGEEEEEEEEREGCSFARTEELWEGQPQGQPRPFVALALSQAAACYDLLLLHLQLANVLHMMAHFNLKFSKPINNLFDSMAHQHFFQDISGEAIIPWYKDDKRDQQRVDFLCRVITASVESIQQETTSSEESLDSRQAIAWMSKCQALASAWKINGDELRIHQVCRLYVNGFDRLAEEVLIAVNDTSRLASKLLPIAGRRMMAHLAQAPDLLEEVSRISPTLTTYLRSLAWDNPSTVYANCTNDDAVELVRKVSRNLPESHGDHHVAQLMLDATFMYAAAAAAAAAGQAAARDS